MTKTIVVDRKSLDERFVKCEPEFIKEVCKGACCKGVKRVCLMPGEHGQIERAGGKIEKRLLVSPGTCPFLNSESLCSLHLRGLKPWSCKISPFVISDNRPKLKLFIHSRYLRQPCHRTEGEPAWKIWRPSLELIFGQNYYLLVKTLETVSTDFVMPIEAEVLNRLIYRRDIMKRA